MINAALLAALIRSCAPHVDFATESAAVESGADPWAIAEPDAHRSYHPRSYEQASSLASSLLAAGHRVAVGLRQVLMSLHGSNVEELLHPCSNLAAPQRVLTADYAEEYRATSAPSDVAHEQLALDRSLSAYNSGFATAPPDYVRLVLEALASPYCSARHYDRRWSPWWTGA